ncbi:F0F1 ATP synthase subunit delta [Candidatus Daviesbacteria bacterium]|nr:F0F1 ATP synthase subunit delta [Candidatus Daviesbacteria bacterium]
MEQQFLNEILKDTFTLESFKKRARVLKLILEKKIFKSEDQSEDGQLPETGKISLNEEEQWASNFDEKILGQVNADNFRELFKVTDQFISDTTSLTIYFVFTADETQIKEIGEWLRRSLNNPNLIFDVKVDAGLIGGCAIAYKGVYKDYSLKAKISQNKEKLMEEFRKYLKN